MSASLLYSPTLGVGHGGLGALDRDAIHRMLQNVLKDLALIGDAVIGSAYINGVSGTAHDIVDPAQNSGENILTDIGRDDGDVHRLGPCRSLESDIGAASLNARDEAVLSEISQGFADSLPAHAEPAAQFTFCGEFVTFFIISAQDLRS